METSIMFHHAIPVHDLAAARAFYGGLLGCTEGKATDKRLNVDFFGHHLVVHLVASEVAARQQAASEGEQAAWRHFGVVLEWPDWERLAGRLPGLNQWHAPHGLVSAVQEMAMITRRHMIDHGTTEDHFAEVAVALRNYKAFRATPIVFVDGEEEKVEKTRERIPAAYFCSRAQLVRTVRKAIREAPKFALIRILFGLFLAERAFWILYYLQPSDWANPGVWVMAVTHLVAAGLVTFGLATQIGREGFQKPVVLKRVLSTIYADPQFRNMFIDEAHISMSLSHSNIVQILDLGLAGGRYFLVLDYLKGTTLSR